MAVDWPPKVRPDFPLTVGERGYYARIAGKSRWICGRLAPEEALKVYHRKAASLVGGNEPMPEPRREKPDAATVHYVLNRWLLARREDAESGGIKPGTYLQYRLSAKRIDKHAGHYLCNDVSPDTTDELYKRLGKSHGADFAKRAVGHWRDALREGADRNWCRAVRFGEKLVAKLTSRPAVTMKWKLFTGPQIRKLLAGSLRDIRAASGGIYRGQAEQFHAMLLLALNGGYGSTELAQLPKAVIDLDGARIDYRRGKTDEEHVVPLWPETVAALRPVLAQRPDDALVFRTRQGNPWCYDRLKMKGEKIVGKTTNDNTADRFNDLARRLGLKVKRQSFYKLRHVFASTADRCEDRNAVSLLMGHALPGSRGRYIKVGEDRLRKVVEYVRHQLILQRDKR